MLRFAIALVLVLASSTLVVVNVTAVIHGGSIAPVVPFDEQAGLRRDLTDAAARLRVADTIIVSVSVTSAGFVDWNVEVLPGSIWPHLDRIGFGRQLPRAERGMAFCRDLNWRMLAATARGQAAAGRDHRRIVTETTSVFRSRHTAYADDPFYCWFNGDRLAFAGPAQAREPEIEPDAGLERPAIEIAIVPDRFTYRFRETVEGEVLVRNHAEHRVPLPGDFLDGLAVSSTDGRAARALAARRWVSGTRDSTGPIMLGPGATHEQRFEIETDALGPLTDPGWEMLPGRWRIHVAKLDRANLSATVRPGLVDVTPRPGQRLEPRIVEVRRDGDRLLLRRENDRVERIELIPDAPPRRVWSRDAFDDHEEISKRRWSGSPCGRYLFRTASGNLSIVAPDGTVGVTFPLPDGWPELWPGRDGVYVTSRSDDDVLRWWAYDGSATVGLAPARSSVLDESADGRLAVIGDPPDVVFWQHGGLRGLPRVQVRDLDGRAFLCEVTDDTGVTALLLDDPPRLVCFRWAHRAEYAAWYHEQIEVRDPRSGALLEVVDLAAGDRR